MVRHVGFWNLNSPPHLTHLQGQTVPSRNKAFKYEPIGAIPSNHHSIPQLFFLLTSQRKQKWSTRLLQLKMLLQELWKKAPTMEIFLLHNLALPPMAWILDRWQFRMPIWKMRSQQATPSLPECIVLPANLSAESWSHNLSSRGKGQSTQEPSLIPNMQFAICSKNKQEPGKVVHIYDFNAQKLKVWTTTVKPKILLSGYELLGLNQTCTHLCSLYSMW